MRTRRFSLGAEELIELGNGRVGVNLDRRPFLSGRPKSVRLELGSVEHLSQKDPLDQLSDVAPYIANRLSDALTALGEIVDTPLTTLSQSVEFVAAKVAGLVQRIPSITDLLSQILVLGGVLVKYGLSIPEMLLRNLGNLIAGIAQGLKAAKGAVELQGSIDKAKKDITEQGDPALSDALASVLESAGVTGQNPAPSVNPGTGQVTVTSLA